MLTLMKLEDRIVLDGAGMAAAADHAADHDAPDPHDPTVDGGGNGHDPVGDRGHFSDAAAGAAALLSESGHSSADPVNVVLISDSLPDPETLINAADPDAHVIVYDADGDSAEDVIGQVVALSEKLGRPVDSLSILSHGDSGGFRLGGGVVTAATLAEDAGAWQNLGSVMSQSANVLVFGCNLADGGESGEALLECLSSATGADVYASNDITGVSGDWDLEVGSEGADDPAGIHTPFDTGRLSTYGDDLAAPVFPGPPAVNLPLLVDVNEDNTTGVYFTLEDDVTPSQELTVTGHSSDQAVIPDANIECTWVSGNIWQVQLTPTPNASTPGSNVTITITADDGAEESSDSFLLGVRPLNDAPSFETINQEVEADDGQQTVSLNQWAQNIDFGPLENPGEMDPQGIEEFFDITHVSGDPSILLGGLSVAPNNHSLIYTPNPDTKGIQTVTYSLRLRDTGGVQFDTPGTGQIIGFDESAPVNITITVIGNNEPPTLTIDAGGDCYEENDPATPMVTGVTISDPDDVNLSRAEVTVSDYQPGEDIISVTNTIPGVSVSFQESTGTLVLDGVAGISQYESILESITYENSSDDPDQGDRILSITIYDANQNQSPNGVQSADDTWSFFVDAIDDAPTLTPAEGTVQYNENDGLMAVGDDLDLADVDDVEMTGATVRITENYIQGEDVLSFVDTAEITGNWDPGTGTLTLTGIASRAQYQAALRAVSYENTSESPSDADRTVRFMVTDANSKGEGDGEAPCTVRVVGPLTGEATRIIQVIPENDGPQITPGDDLCYAENDEPTPINPGLLLTDEDSDFITNAVVRISQGYQPGEDILRFNDTAEITGSWDPGTGTLVLTGTATVAEYQAALRSVTYENTSEDPVEGDRQVTFVATDDNTSGAPNGPATSQEVSATIFVDSVNDAPDLVASQVDDLNYNTTDDAVVIDGGLTLSDIDDDQIENAVVRIRDGYQQGQDFLNFTDTAEITGTWDPGTGTLTLSGVASKAAYEAALRSVTFTNTSDEPVEGNRVIEMTVTDRNSDGDGTGICKPVEKPGGVMQDIEIIRTITVTDFDIDLQPDPLCYVENDPATPLAGDLSLTANDELILTGAVVEFSEGYQPGEDLLEYTPIHGIEGRFENGRMVLTGSATVAQYQEALRSVTYRNVVLNGQTEFIGLNDDPTEGSATEGYRGVTFSVSNEDGVLATDNMKLLVDAIDDPPVLSIEDGPINWVNEPVAVGGTVSISDVDDTQMTRAVIRISDGYVAGQDVLRFADTPNIIGTWNSETGALTLATRDGAAVDAGVFAAAIQSVTYDNLAANPDPQAKTISFTVFDNNSDGEGDKDICAPTQAVGPLSSTVVTRNIVFNPPPHRPPYEPPPIGGLILEPIPRPGIGDLGGLELGDVRFPGEVQETGQPRPVFRALSAPCGDDVLYECCTLEEALRIGCRFAPALNRDARLCNITWDHMRSTLGWEDPFVPRIDGEYFNEEVDLFNRLFMREEGDPGFCHRPNVFADAFGAAEEEAFARYNRDEEHDIYSQLSMREAQGFNDVDAGEFKDAFFRGREGLDKPARWRPDGDSSNC